MYSAMRQGLTYIGIDDTNKGTFVGYLIANQHIYYKKYERQNTNHI